MLMYKIQIKTSYGSLSFDTTIENFDTYESAAQYLLDDTYIKQGSELYYKEFEGMTFRAEINNI